MAKKTPARYTMIYDYINQYYGENGRYPSVRDIVAGTGIPVSTVHRYLNDMKESGEIEYNGHRSISTSQTEMESPSRYMKVL
ncbi:MAG: helix-turn-helix domain-containing protein, partial [Ruminococcus sp.]|nr:helix-turn-helix domain-containing protein [Ruminococcus sp.]